MLFSAQIPAVPHSKAGPTPWAGFLVSVDLGGGAWLQERGWVSSPLLGSCFWTQFGETLTSHRPVGGSASTACLLGSPHPRIHRPVLTQRRAEHTLPQLVSSIRGGRHPLAVTRAAVAEGVDRAMSCHQGTLFKSNQSSLLLSCSPGPSSADIKDRHSATLPPQLSSPGTYISYRQSCLR